MKRLFAITQADTPVDLALLLLRVGVSIFMIHHGYSKIEHFPEMQEKFMSFLGLSGSISLCLVIFSEVFCSIAVILGLVTRLALIPLIISSSVAAIVAHNGDIFGKGELITIFLIAYLALFLAGPGRYSIDAMFAPRKS